MRSALRANASSPTSRSWARARRGAVQRDRAQGQRAVGVVDDRDLAGPAGGSEVGRLVEQQPVGGVDGDQLRRLDVGSPAELVEAVGGPHGVDHDREFAGVM